MPVDLSRADAAELVARLSPYLRLALERAAAHASRLHADAIAVEHFVHTLLEDEESALYRLTVHAFADPETIAADVLALSPGMLVVGSDATIPFSPSSVGALQAARERARSAGAAEIAPADVLVAAQEALPEDLRAALAAAGYDRAALAVEAELGRASTIELAANLFHHFSPDARRLVSRAGRAAFRARELSIGPARLMLAALDAETGLEARSGLSRSRARLVLEGRTADPTPAGERPLALEASLGSFLAALPAGGDSLEVLELLHRDPASELTQAFARQKVSSGLIARARGAFEDPAGDA